jgi:chitin disaccharide deacetylase
LPECLLIINADDFGFTRGVNEGIVRCAEEGVLRSTTLMANGEAFDHAVAAARTAERLSVGVHLVLTDLHPVASTAGLGGMIREGGRLPRGPWGLLSAMSRGHVPTEVLRRELTAQMEKVLDHGIRPTHLDSHKHVHVFPPVLNAVIHVAKRFGIRWIRNPFDATGNLGGVLREIEDRCRPGFVMQAFEARLAHVLRPYFFHSIRTAGLRTPQRFYGTALTGFWNFEAARRVLHRLPPAICEWMVHPGNADDTLVRSGTRLTASREKEKALLLSHELRRFFDEHSLTPKSFGDISS